MAKEAFYFSHDSNAFSDEKIQCLVADHGLVGYGIYWALIERMFESKETSLNHALLRGLAFSLNIDITLLSSVITTCIDVKLFISDGDYFHSESLRRRKRIWEDSRQKKSEAGKKGMAKRWANFADNQSNAEKVDNSVVTEHNTVITEDNKLKKSKLKEKEIDINTGIPFFSFWQLYDKKVGSKTKVEKKWNSLTPQEHEAVFKHVPEYKKAQPNKQFRKNPEAYLNNESWNDEIIRSDSTSLSIVKSSLVPPRELDFYSTSEYQAALSKYNAEFKQTA